MFERLALAISLSLFSLTAAAQAPEPVPPGATRDADGLAWVVLKEGSGAAPVSGDFVTLDYTVWSGDGEILDSTAKHPYMRTFPFDKVFPGLHRTLTTMKTHEKRRVWVPGSLSPTKEPLVLEVELLEVGRPLDAPPDVAAPPADAVQSKSGLAWKVLRAGEGSSRPGRNSTVTVHYTGWTVDAKMFDSSLLRGDASSFKLTEVIPGWTEGLQLMVPGEKRRFWIPSKLAYRGQPGRPAGMLVFDIELLRFH